MLFLIILFLFLLVLFVDFLFFFSNAGNGFTEANGTPNVDCYSGREAPTVGAKRPAGAWPGRPRGREAPSGREAPAAHAKQNTD